MSVLLILFSNVVLALLSILQWAMLVRAVLSWFIMDGKFIEFLHAITEPFIMPVRALMRKMNWLQNSPIDFSFMITYILISMVILFLP